MQGFFSETKRPTYLVASPKVWDAKAVSNLVIRASDECIKQVFVTTIQNEIHQQRRDASNDQASLKSSKPAKKSKFIEMPTQVEPFEPTPKYERKP